MNLQQVKQRFEIIGNSPQLNRALEVAIQVAPTDISVLVTGESGTGKEIIPQVIHNLSARKHKQYIAVNCGAIPEGTIDSELFGHEKGSFTGAVGSRQGYFEVADGGTIFLDEVAELPMQTQVRLLRVLETGEFMRVGSSKMIKTNVRVVAATNENMQKAVASGKFREDLYYRLSTVPISLPPLRDRGDDIHLLFRKFASDFSEKYRMPTVRLTNEAISLVNHYQWPGNIRQLRNVVEQISIIETERELDAVTLQQYLPTIQPKSTMLATAEGQDSINERELMYKFLFDMKRDLTELKKLVVEIINKGDKFAVTGDQVELINRLYADIETPILEPTKLIAPVSSEVIIPQDNQIQPTVLEDTFEAHEVVEESLSLEDQEKELIRKALDKHRGRRKNAAQELGISERTLYRKIKEYDITE
ncbi:MAG: sigma-54 dependent transcriptional regulator [Crocinitomicaceae bacterium]|nr:sigma-54 dependent transcriptional regulator [Crocinitomicaceae bacterium]